MARVDYLFACSSIREESPPADAPPGQRLIAAVQPLPFLNPRTVPTEYGFGVCGCVSHFDVNADHTISVGFFGVNGEELFRSRPGPLKVPDVLSYPRDVAAVMIALQVQNVLLAHEGDYVLRIIFDGEDVGHTVVPVYQHPKP